MILNVQDFFHNKIIGITSLRFFGIRFLAIWVFPLIVTGTVMEVLFVRPLRGVSPFN